MPICKSWLLSQCKRSVFCKRRMQLLLWPLSKGLCEDEIPGHVVMFSKLDEALHKYKMMVSYLTSYFLSHSYTLPQIYCSRLHNAPPNPRQRSSCFNSLNLWIFPSYAVKLRTCDTWGLFWIITWAQGSLLEEGNRSESEKTTWQLKQSVEESEHY